MNDLPVPAKWFPGGPSFALFPYPVIDQTKKGTGCTNCGERCSGHYVTDLTHYFNLYSQGKALRSPPPSQILQDFYKEIQSFVEADIERLADRCLLPLEEVNLWLHHLQQVDENRIKGAEKAKATRQEKKAKK